LYHYQKPTSKAVDRKSRLHTFFQHHFNGLQYIMYKILKSDSPQKLEFEVQKYLNNGWTVAGGVTVSPASVFFQAVVNSTKIKLHTKKRL